jgi:hypothetical protein
MHKGNAAKAIPCDQAEQATKNTAVSAGAGAPGLCPAGVAVFRSGDSFLTSRLDLIRARVALRRGADGND